MASITIRRIDDSVKARLRVRAASRGRSMEQETREILKAGLMPGSTPSLNLVDAIRRHIKPLGGVALAIPTRQPVRLPVKFGK
jgi:antitoxin FitA